MQKNGKTIRYCVVDVGPHGQMETEGKHQEIVCGATNFEVGDLVVVVLPGAVLAGGFEIAARKTYGHVSNGMICAEDELGIGDDHSGIIVLTRLLSPEQLDGVQVGDDAIALLGLGEEVVEVNVTPDRGYCFSMRGLAREYWHSQGSPDGGFRDPALVCRVPAPTERRVCGPARRRGADRRAGRLRPVRRADRARHRPDPAVTAVDAAPADADGDAADLAGRRRHELRHARARAAAARLRHRHAQRRDRGAPRAAGGDAHDPRRRRARTLDPEDLLITDGGDAPLGIAGVMGGATSEVQPDDDRRARRGRALRPGHRRPLVAAPQAGQRGVEAVRARRRPGAAAGRGPALRRPARRARRRHRRPGRDRRRRDHAARARTSSTSRCRPGWSASTTRASASSRSSGPRAARSTTTAARPSGHAADVAPRPGRRAGLRRGGRPDRRLRQDPVDRAHAALGSRADPRRSGSGASSPTRSWRAGSSRC